ncbi:hypothetical protein AC20117_19810 [Arthrobacter crystallopoietes]|nr:hypothetical protein AC20117_19810 [Arthrobacter crystallopoietes]
MFHQHIPYNRLAGLSGNVRSQNVFALYSHFAAAAGDLERNSHFYPGLPLPDHKDCFAIGNSC